MKCEEGGDLGGGRGDSEVRWVAQIGRVGWREGIRLEVGGNERHVNSTFR